ncbi:1,4-dihydroxy-2-naphthoate octaprenyltransferase [Thermaurantimonas aggregans]|uniref:1,4-dihydroxy-2-naphthoate octaprenyltransferase n=1 Tax=Thermaurantimonas aggregans TaxID=2173829 RepID=A0A401XI53_9FLAO|nr:1,4-dihydroxy-2-naphthoate octaprenyltransferase [Thermaurantimonas aggregans]MCX8149303.1 1,4-dihydroxy-2-naphthoate octaprenyltransferase [Thermaurantimonas aggregans]GCD76700.1 1,4-dihydroxy-2-naphthoate octaprenyltransferase [Thermaurantimonas aggregans]
MLTHWISAARLRTLPLSLSGIVLGTLIARAEVQLDVVVLVLAMLTAVFFQVLSNFANDLGDALTGADSHRKGEKRMVASGVISPKAMKKAMLLFAGLSAISGVLLLHIALRNLPVWIFGLFLGLALLSIWSAINYTYGSFSYGYKRMGEVFVTIFFGLIAVGGSYFLQTKFWNPLVLLPGLSVGLMASAVLNLNNMRDMETDLASGKYTIANYLGFKNSKWYHLLLLLIPIVLPIPFIEIGRYGRYSYLYLFVVPALVGHIAKVFQIKTCEAYDPELKKVALMTLLYVLLLGFGINL